MSHEICGDKIIFFDVGHEDGPPNPLEDFDAYGTIWSFSPRHNNFKNPQEIECHPDRVGLSYHEHGNCEWFVKGTKYPPDMRWDGREHAGIWEPDDCLRAEVKGMDQHARRKKMEKYAEEACKIYTEWCNGEVYEGFYNVYLLKKTEDDQPLIEEHYYAEGERVEEDRFGNYYGYEGEQQIQAAIDAVRAKHKKAAA